MKKLEGEINIVDKEKKIVATLSWFGNTTRGTGAWTNMASSKITKIITDVMSRNVDLSAVRYSEMVRDSASVRGWQGFSGYLQALNEILPSVGLAIDWSTIRWPVDPRVLEYLGQVS